MVEDTFPETRRLVLAQVASLILPDSLEDAVEANLNTDSWNL